MFAVDGEIALCGGGQPKQHFHGGGFTGAVGTEKTIDSSLLDVQGDIVDSCKGFVPFG